MNIYAQIVTKIIKSQENIIGPVAIEQAQRVTGLHVDWPNNISLEGNEPKVIDDLVAVYKELFGQVSVDVSKQAAAPLLSK